MLLMLAGMETAADQDNNNSLLSPAAAAKMPAAEDGDIEQGWKFMSCRHCQELGQQASWPLIGYTRVNNQSEARSAS